jgi:hypothetical protein
LNPFWSPDSKSIAFWVAGKLKRTDLAGTPPVTLTQLDVSRCERQHLLPRSFREGATVVPNPGFLFLLSTMMTLGAGSTLVFLVAKLVSRWGVGNGFCLFVLLQYMRSAFAGGHNSVPATDLVFGNLLEVLAWLAAIGLLVWSFGRRPLSVLKDSQQETIPLLTLPVFSQGILPSQRSRTVAPRLTSRGCLDRRFQPWSLPSV